MKVRHWVSGLFLLPKDFTHTGYNPPMGLRADAKEFDTTQDAEKWISENVSKQFQRYYDAVE